MANRVRRIVLSFGFLFIIAGAADARSIFVNKASLVGPPDGSATKPFRTITQALVLARQIRFGSPSQDPSNETINLQVFPETYVGVFGAPTFTLTPEPREALPLILNVPNLKLQGTLRFKPDGTLVGGTKTSLEATTQPLEKQHMVVVTRTSPTVGSEFPTSLEMVGDGVTISGFVSKASVGVCSPR